MKKTGRGTSYKKALLTNLTTHLRSYKKITTTRTRAKKLAEHVFKKHTIAVTLKPAPNRRGDNAPQTTVEIIEQKAIKPTNI